jgi:hypothetical protein
MAQKLPRPGPIRMELQNLGYDFREFPFHALR